MSETSSMPSKESLIMRIFLFLEDGDKVNADIYCEKVLDIDPTCGEAYLGKLMIALNIRKREELGKIPYFFESDPNYQKILRFGSEEIISEVKGYISQGLESRYLDAKQAAASAVTEVQFKEAAEKFRNIPNYKDCAQLSAECLRKAEIARKENIDATEFQRKDGIYTTVLERMANCENWQISEAVIPTYRTVILQLQSIPGYRDSDALLKKYQAQLDEINSKLEVMRKDNIYNSATSRMASCENWEASLDAVKAYEESISLLQSVPAYKDSDELVIKYKAQLDEINSKLEAMRIAKKSKIKKRLIAIASIFLAFAIFVTVFFNFTSLGKYARANINIMLKDYEEAYYILKELDHDNYHDATKKLKSFVCIPTKETYTKNGKTYISTTEVEVTGRRFLQTTLTEDGLQQKSEKVYDKKGNCIEYTTSDSEELNSEFSHMVYNSLHCVKYTYDSNNNCTLEEKYDYSDNLVLTVKNTYNSEGNLIKREEYNKNQEPLFSTIYTYDNNNCTKAFVKQSNGKTWQTITYTYDSNNNCTKKTQEYGQPVTSSKIFEYTYDADGNCIKETCSDPDDGFESTYERTYDKYGNCIKETLTNSVGHNSTTTYSDYMVYYIGD